MIAPWSLIRCTMALSTNYWYRRRAHVQAEIKHVADGRGGRRTRPAEHISTRDEVGKHKLDFDVRRACSTQLRQPRQ